MSMKDDLVAKALAIVMEHGMISAMYWLAEQYEHEVLELQSRLEEIRIRGDKK